MGHKVTVVTSTYAKSDIRSDSFISRFKIDGIDIIHINVRIDNKAGFSSRVFAFVSYCIVASYFAVTERSDVAIASSGPITVGIPGIIARILGGKGLVFEVRDLWPSGVVELGILKNPLLIKACFLLERTCYRLSRRIITLSPGMTDNIKHRYGLQDVFDVTNSANIELMRTGQGFIIPKVIQGKKIILYTGNIGAVNNSTLLLDVARVLKQRNLSDYFVLLVGDGQQSNELQDQAHREHLDNFMIHPLVPKTQLASLVRASFASIVPLKNAPILNTSSPNKLFESLAAGIPVIQTTSGWIKDLLHDFQMGATVSPDDPNALVDILVQWSSDQTGYRKICTNAAAYAERHFDKNVLAYKMMILIGGRMKPQR